MVSLFTEKKIYKFHQIYCKCEWKKCKMKEIKYIFLSSSSYGTVINCGSGPVPTFKQVKFPVPVPLGSISTTLFVVRYA
jgi:hypothetical protein